jgi:hypothetical protein
MWRKRAVCSAALFQLFFRLLHSGFAKIGSMIALSHDLCEVPLDLFKLAALRGMRNTQVGGTCVTTFGVATRCLFLIRHANLSVTSVCVNVLSIQLVTLAVALLMYLYWRVWFFCSRVLYTVAFESKTMIDQVDCVPGDCTWSQVPERAPFLMCLVVLLVVNCVSISRMVRIGYRILHPSCVL